MAIQNELIGLLEAESEATAAYAAIVLAQLTKFSAEKDNQHQEIEKVNQQMKKIIANRVGADHSYENYTDDQLLNFNYEGNRVTFIKFIYIPCRFVMPVFLK